MKVDLPVITAKQKYESAINIANQRLQKQNEEAQARAKRTIIDLPTAPKLHPKHKRP